MQLDMDKIVFESRAEIGAVIKALEELEAYRQNDRHSKRDVDTDSIVYELMDKLDAMSMSW